MKLTRIRLTVFVVTVMLSLAGCEQIKDAKDRFGQKAEPAVKVATPEAMAEAPTSTPAASDILITMADPPSKQDAVAVMKARMETQEHEAAGHPTPTPTVVPYSRLKNGVVVAEAIGLMWTEAASGAFSQEDAEAWCASVSTGGHSDWRLPAVVDLKSVLATGFRPSGTSQNQRLWSATAHPVRGFQVFDFSTGEIILLDYGLAQALCVRAAD